MKYWFFILTVLLLSSCGGGGADSGGSALSFTPASINEEIAQGDDITFTVNAKVNIIPDGYVYVAIIDSAGVFVQQYGLTPTANYDGSYTTTLQINPNLLVGTYSSNVKVLLCKDISCNAQYSGSPSILPVTIKVNPATNLTPLAKRSGLFPWVTYQGNNQHVGFVPLTVDPSAISLRWSWGGSSIRGGNQPVAINNKLYLSTLAADINNNINGTLVALNESDGSVSWQHVFNGTGFINPVAYGDGKLFLSTMGQAQAQFIHSFDESGNSLSSVSFDGQSFTNLAPVYENGYTYFNGGFFGGYINRLNVGLETIDWKNQNAQRSYDSTPALDADYLYAWSSNSCDTCDDAGLAIHDKSTGERLELISHIIGDKARWSSLGTAALIYDRSSIITNTSGAEFSNNQLVSFNALEHKVNWAIDGVFVNYALNPNEKVLYATSQNPYRVEARNLDTGDLLWSWTPPTESEPRFANNIVVTNNIIFVSTASRIYAIDTSTHQLVWKFSGPGSMAISDNGILYITNPWKPLRAINLQ